jgi:hypothetical protein
MANPSTQVQQAHNSISNLPMQLILVLHQLFSHYFQQLRIASVEPNNGQLDDLNKGLKLFEISIPVLTQSWPPPARPQHLIFDQEIPQLEMANAFQPNLRYLTPTPHQVGDEDMSDAEEQSSDCLPIERLKAMISLGNAMVWELKHISECPICRSERARLIEDQAEDPVRQPESPNWQDIMLCQRKSKSDPLINQSIAALIRQTHLHPNSLQIAGVCASEDISVKHPRYPDEPSSAKKIYFTQNNSFVSLTQEPERLAVHFRTLSTHLEHPIFMVAAMTRCGVILAARFMVPFMVKGVSLEAHTDLGPKVISKKIGIIAVCRFDVSAFVAGDKDLLIESFRSTIGDRSKEAWHEWIDHQWQSNEAWREFIPDNLVAHPEQPRQSQQHLNGLRETLV